MSGWCLLVFCNLFCNVSSIFCFVSFPSSQLARPSQTNIIMTNTELNNAKNFLFEIAREESEDSCFAAEFDKLIEAKEQLLDRLHEFEERKRNSSAVSDDGSKYVRDDDIVEINAGGKIIAARRGTLCRWKGTRLEALFSGRWDKKLQRDGCGRIFLDVNGDCFQAIVDYLHDVAISSEDDPSEPPTVDDEGYRQVLAQYSELFGLRVPPHMDSNIITQYSQVKLLHKWLNEQEASSNSSGSTDVELTLIYHSSKENLSNEIFHSKCDNKGRTLVVIETTEGHVVGGYTNSDWDSPNDPNAIGHWSKANKSFLFAMTGFDLSSPLKMNLRNKNGKHAIYNCSQYGPAFGGGCSKCDLKVTESSVYLNTGHVYERGKSEKLTDGHSYTINEMEVFRVSDVGISHGSTHPRRKPLRRFPKQKQVKRFTKEMSKALDEKWAALRELEAELRSLEERLDDEEHFIDTFASGKGRDLITLNVSGTMMITKRSTLQVIDDSMLARQFDDTKWTEQGCLRVKDWTPGDVMKWVKSIDGIPDDVASVFGDHEVNGLELLVLNEFGLEKIGVKRAGTICLLLEHIQSLKETASQVMGTLIEHSPYCFGKILDYLRLKRLHNDGFIDEPPLPIVCDNQKNRFQKVVRYYFPGDSSVLFFVESPKPFS